MSDLQATLEFSLELCKFYNVDLFQRGWVYAKTALLYNIYEMFTATRVCKRRRSWTFLKFHLYTQMRMHNSQSNESWWIVYLLKEYILPNCKHFITLTIVYTLGFGNLIRVEKEIYRVLAL